MSVSVVLSRELDGPHVRPAVSGDASVMIDCSWRFLIVRGEDMDLESGLIRLFKDRAGDGEYLRGGSVAEDDLPVGSVLIWRYAEYARGWSIAEKQGAAEVRVALRARALRDTKSIASGLARLRGLSNQLHALPDSSSL